MRKSFLLGLALGFVFAFTGRAFGQGSDERIRLDPYCGLSSPIVSAAGKAPAVAHIDTETVAVPSDHPEDDPVIAFDDLLLGGGFGKDVSAGKEHIGAYNFFLFQYGVRFTGWNVGSQHVQPGVRVGYEHGWFESGKYEADESRYVVGGEVAVFPKETEYPDYQVVGRLFLVFGNQDGSSRVNSFKMEEDYINLRFELLVNYLGFFRPTGLSDSHWGRQVKEGWIPNVQLWFQHDQMLTGSASGSVPSQEENDVSYTQGNIKLHLRRDAWWGGSLEYGPLVGFKSYKAYGYQSADDGDRMFQVNVGAFAEVEFIPEWFLYAEGTYGTELGTGRDSLALFLALEVKNPIQQVRSLLGK